MERTKCPNCNAEKTIWLWNNLGDRLKCKKCKTKFTFKWFKWKINGACGIEGDYPLPPRPNYIPAEE